MIGTIIVGSGNTRTVIERHRNAQFSRQLRDGIIAHLGLKPYKGRPRHGK